MRTPSNAHLGLLAAAVACAAVVACLAERPADAPAATSQPASRPATTQPAATFTVATYNILGLNRDLKAVARTIRRSNADLVCLQEANADAARYLKADLRDAYRHMDFRPAAGLSGLGFLAKRPFRQVRFLRRKFGRHDAWIIRARLAGALVHVAGVHLEPTLPADGDLVVGTIGRLMATEEVREKEIDRVLDALPKGAPAVVLGDFNSTSRMVAPRRMAERGFTDSFASVIERADGCPTWTGAYGLVPLSARIDYVFHTKELRTTSSRIINGKGSDHSLVVSTLTLAPRAATQPVPGD